MDLGRWPHGGLSLADRLCLPWVCVGYDSTGIPLKTACTRVRPHPPLLPSLLPRRESPERCGCACIAMHCPPNHHSMAPNA